MADLDLDALERLAKDEDRDREELEIVADAFPRVLSRLRAAERERDEYLAACQATHGVHPSWVTWALQADTLKRELAEARAALAEAERIGCLACRVREENGG